MRLGRALAAAAAAAALALMVAGCGDDPEDDAATAYADEVEAILEGDVTPAATAASDAMANVAQGEPDVEGVAAELDDIAAELRSAQDALAGLDPPGASRDPAEELIARIGILADRIAATGAAELERDPRQAAENVRTDLDRIQRRARLTIGLARGEA